jgi:uncharacterized protein (DUF58 family)
MILRPSRRLILLLLAGSLPASLAGVSPVFAAAAILVDVFAVLLFVVDVWLARKDAGLVVRRLMPDRVSRRKPFEVKLSVHNPADRSVRVEVVDRLPESFEPRGRTLTLSLMARQQVERPQKVVALRRGTYDVRAPVAERSTPLGLGIARARAEGTGTIAVLPDTQALGQFDALVRQRRLHEMGVARVRERGEGTEIAGLRPYALGDPYGRIDWKATARRSALISREMHTERRQNVVLMLDCGRRMAREAEGRSRLDHAIEAALLLSHVALRSDDRVGLVAFADRMLRVVRPVRGHASARVLAQAIFALEPVLREPPYESVAASVSHHFRRRSLMVLFTDAVEPASLEVLAKPVRFLSQRHLVLCVVFQDASMEAALREVPNDAGTFFRAGAASALAVERDRGLRQLRHAGALLLEAPAAKLSTQVINRYLEVKARHLL